MGRGAEEVQRTVNMGPAVPGVRNEGFPAGSLFDPLVRPRNVAGGGSTEMSSIPRGGEGNRGMQSNERGDKPSAGERSRSLQKDEVP